MGPTTGSKAGRFLQPVIIFLLLTSFLLLIITDITSPTNRDISLFSIRAYKINDLSTFVKMDFGLFGYCAASWAEQAGQRLSLPKFCVNARRGADWPADALESFSQTILVPAWLSNRMRERTLGFVLPPIATGFVGLALLLAIGLAFRPIRIVAIVSAVVTAISFCLTLGGMVCVFLLARDVKDKLPYNVQISGIDASRPGNTYFTATEYGAGIWCLMVAFILLFFSVILGTITCFGGQQKQASAKSVGEKHVGSERGSVSNI